MRSGGALPGPGYAHVDLHAVKVHGPSSVPLRWQLPMMLPWDLYIRAHHIARRFSTAQAWLNGTSNHRFTKYDKRKSPTHPDSITVHRGWGGSWWN